MSTDGFVLVVPCHRVVAAGGKTGGFSANGGVRTKLRLLAIERSGALDPEVLPIRTPHPPHRLTAR